MGLLSSFSVSPYVVTEKNRQNASLISAHSQQDRFRGALLGLELTPTAVSMTLTDYSEADKAKLATEMNAAISYTMEQIRLFLSAPSMPLQKPHSTAHRKTWLDAVPTILRYHEHTARYHRWQADAAATAQYWLLSDILTAVLNGQSLNKAWLTQQIQQTVQTDSGSSTARHYRWLWHSLETTLFQRNKRIYKNANRRQSSRLLTSENLTSHEMAYHRAVVSGVSCALAAMSEGQAADTNCHFGLSVSMATQQVSAGTDWHAPLIAGFISGAIVGQSNLPISWQQRSSTDGISLADALYCQWSGSLL